MTNKTILDICCQGYKGHVAFHDCYMITGNTELLPKIIQPGYEPRPRCSLNTIWTFAVRVSLLSASFKVLYSEFYRSTRHIKSIYGSAVM